MAWWFVLAAGAAEIGFAASLGAADGFTRPAPSAGVVVFGTAAVVLLSRALREVPLGVGYAAFTAIGAVGATLVGAAVRDEHLTPGRIAALALVVAGVVALRLTDGAAS
jgi:quaternary ammonium compound-resistance protein SugE